MQEVESRLEQRSRAAQGAVAEAMQEQLPNAMKPNKILPRHR